jgi:hypothetical protein
LEEVRQRLIDTFKRWGKPGALRVDNGLPFGVPGGDSTPVLALWLIAMEVKMIWNDPYCPQQNARVEKMQDTTSRWAEIEVANNTKHLQNSLNEAIRLQRELYPVERLEGKTRLVAFSGLNIPHRLYAPEDFNIQRVYAFLQTKVYTRKVSPCGQVAHFGELNSVGRSLRGQFVQLRLGANGSAWQVYADYKIVKLIAADNLREECIRNLTKFQRTNNKT